MRPSHDDQLRALAASGDRPAQLTPTIVNRARIIQAPHLRMGFESRQLVQTRGAMKRFLAHARTVQNLPSFAKRMRE